MLSVDYRLAPEHPFPAAVEDAQAASAGRARNAGELGADPARIAVGGDSAGGNLAAGVSLHRDARRRRRRRRRCSCSIYPATDAVEAAPSRRLFAEGFLLTQMRHGLVRSATTCPPRRSRYDPRASILRAPDLSGLPPAYVATAGFDPLRDEGEAYAARMREAGVQVALRRHPGLIHGFANLTAVSRARRGRRCSRRPGRCGWACAAPVRLRLWRLTRYSYCSDSSTSSREARRAGRDRGQHAGERGEDQQHDQRADRVGEGEAFVLQRLGDQRREDHARGPCRGSRRSAP